MNLKNAKILSQKEIYSVLPNNWIDIFDNCLSIIKHSKFPTFKHAEIFFTAALSYIQDKENSPIKHIKTKCNYKGEKDGKIYISLDIYFMMKNKCLWKLSKSIHVTKRNVDMTYD